MGPAVTRSFPLVAEDLLPFPYMFSSVQLALRQQFSSDTPYDI